MIEPLNGQVVAALSQWQGAVLILVALVVGAMVRRWSRRLWRVTR